MVFVVKSGNIVFWHFLLLAIRNTEKMKYGKNGRKRERKRERKKEKDVW